MALITQRFKDRKVCALHLGESVFGESETVEIICHINRCVSIQPKFAVIVRLCCIAPERVVPYRI